MQRNKRWSLPSTHIKSIGKTNRHQELVPKAECDMVQELHSAWEVHLVLEVGDVQCGSGKSVFSVDKDEEKY